MKFRRTKPPKRLLKQFKIANTFVKGATNDGYAQIYVVDDKIYATNSYIAYIDKTKKVKTPLAFKTEFYGKTEESWRKIKGIAMSEPHFKKINSLLRSKTKFKVLVNKDSLITCLKAFKKSETVLLEFTGEEKVIKLSSQNNWLGEPDETMKALLMPCRQITHNHQ